MNELLFWIQYVLITVLCIAIIVYVLKGKKKPSVGVEKVSVPLSLSTPLASKVLLKCPKCGKLFTEDDILKVTDFAFNPPKTFKACPYCYQYLEEWLS
jgi:hypothetical protein